MQRRILRILSLNEWRKKILPYITEETERKKTPRKTREAEGKPLKEQQVDKCERRKGKKHIKTQ